jgi:cation diffusion facilitator family transporter
MADAVNNLSDSASSVITLVAFKLAGAPADEEHPYGHARIEYISGLVVSFLILAIGVEFLISSVRKILEPSGVIFTPAVAVILLVSIAVKLWQGLFNKNVGERISSTALKATAADSLNDVVATVVVLAGAIIAHVSGYHLDGWMGLLVAAFILVSGVRMVIETISPLLGMAPDCDMVAELEQKILSYDSVLGIHDLMVHNYGPGRSFASVHVEVPASQDILISHDIIDNIEREVTGALGLELVIHLDPIVTDDERLSGYRKYVADAVKELDPQLTIHDFRMVEGKTHTNLIFDVVVPPRYEMTDNALREVISRQVCKLQENLFCVITVDRSYTSTRGDTQ